MQGKAYLYSIWAVLNVIIRVCVAECVSLCVAGIWVVLYAIAQVCHCPGMFYSASEAPRVFCFPTLHENDKYACVMARTTTHAYVT